jgi:hypothetical protein
VARLTKQSLYVTFAESNGPSRAAQEGGRGTSGRSTTVVALDSAQARNSSSERVGRLGLEPRTHGFKEDRSAALGARPAPMSREYARKAHTAHSRYRHSFHETFHGTRAMRRHLRDKA